MTNETNKFGSVILILRNDRSIPNFPNVVCQACLR